MDTNSNEKQPSFNTGITVKLEVPDDASSEGPDKFCNKYRRCKFISSSRARVVALKNELHEKGNLLATTWTELNQLLGEYQAELYTNEENILASKDKYEGITDIDTLKNELAEKESIIRELEERLANAESKIQSVGLDLSVKNSLLNKYQQELLQKDSSLLNIQTAKHKLENRNRALEVRLSKIELESRTVSPLASPLAAVSPLVSPMVSPLAAKRKSPGIVVLQGSSKRKALAPKPSAKEFVCFDEGENSIDDAEDLRINDTIEPWPDGNGTLETDTTSRGSLPGNADYSDSVPLDGSIPESAIRGYEVQPSTSTDELGQMAQNELLAGDPEKSSPQHKTHHANKFRPIKPKPGFFVPDPGLQPRPWVTATNSISHRLQCRKCHQVFSCTQDMFQHNVSAHGAKSYVCPVCGKAYSRRTIWKQHVDTHSGVRRFVCDSCGAEFSMQNSYYRHVNMYCKNRMK